MQAINVPERWIKPKLSMIGTPTISYFLLVYCHSIDKPVLNIHLNQFTMPINIENVKIGY